MHSMCWTARSDGSIELHFVRPDLSGIFVSEVAQACNELFNTDISMRAIHFAEGPFVTGIEARQDKVGLGTVGAYRP